MKKLIFLAICLALPFSHAGAASVFYIALDGRDDNPGTKSQPFATLQAAQSAVHPGDTVYIRGGLYHIPAEQIARTERIYACVTFLYKSGEPGKYIHYWAYPGERPVFDYSGAARKKLSYQDHCR